MKVLIAAVLLVMALPACTSIVWQKPGTTPEAAQSDSRDCDRQADQQSRAAWEPGHQAPISRAVPPSLRQSEHRRRYAQCMSARGYVEVEASK